MKTHILQILGWLCVLNLAINGYFSYQDYRLKQHKTSLERKLAATSAELASTTESLNLLKEDLTNTKNERNDFEQKYNDEKTRMDFLETQIGDLKSMVGIIEKLHQVDPELLKKYSKVYFLNENYVPEKLVRINPEYVYDPKNDLFFLDKILSDLQNLMDGAFSTSIDIKILSAFRSFEEQAGLKFSYNIVYGSGANKFSADQGYSEHQLGAAVDFTTSKLGASLSSFEKTEAYQWLAENAYKYGFILSYPANNSYYKIEPWHWRFVGKSLAGKLHDDNKSFYDLDQRLIDTYLLLFFD